MKTKMTGFISSILLVTASLVACTTVPDDEIISGAIGADFPYSVGESDDRLVDLPLWEAAGSSAKPIAPVAGDDVVWSQEDTSVSDEPSDSHPTATSERKQPNAPSAQADSKDDSIPDTTDLGVDNRNSASSKEESATATADPPADGTGPEKADDPGPADDTTGSQEFAEGVVVDLPNRKSEPAEIQEGASTPLTVPTVAVEGSALLVHPERRRKRPWTVYWKP